MYKIYYEGQEIKKAEEGQDILVSPKIPPIYFKLKEKFGIEWEGEDNIIICDGETLHCKAAPIPPEKLVHEIEHVKRQKIYGKDLWWSRYLEDPEFRLQEEAIAYQKEYSFIVKNIKDREGRFKFLYEMARSLSSPQYGSIISFTEAQKLIANR